MKATGKYAKQRGNKSTYRPSVDCMLVLKNPVEDRGVGEDDKPEAARSAGYLVKHDDSLQNFTVLGEVFYQLLLRRLP